MIRRAADGRVLFAPLPHWREAQTGDPDKLNAGCWTLFGGEPAVCCPQCYQWSLLENRVKGTKHRVDDLGNVNPSIVHAVPGCTFHEWGRLEEWKTPVTVAEKIADERNKHAGGPRYVEDDEDGAGGAEQQDPAS